MNNIDLAPIKAFLACATPQAWIDAALEHPAELLIDHANCEKKAAATAMNLMHRYTGFSELLEKMAQLAREELLHFEQVVRLLRARGIPYDYLGASRYASSLRAAMRNHEPARLVDILVVGAFVEARSCERFAALVPHVDEQLARFYKSLLRSEARHFEDYLALAKVAAAGESIEARVAHFAVIEADLITSPDTEFRFHSGPPGVSKKA